MDSYTDERDDLTVMAEQLRAAAKLIEMAGYSRHSLQIPVYDGQFSVWTAVLTACDGVEPRAEEILNRVAGTLLLAGFEPAAGDYVSMLVSNWEAFDTPEAADVTSLLTATAESLDALAAARATSNPY